MKSETFEIYKGLITGRSALTIVYKGKMIKPNEPPLNVNFKVYTLPN
jgi:hypothetical protein